MSLIKDFPINIRNVNVSFMWKSYESQNTH